MQMQLEAWVFGNAEGYFIWLKWIPIYEITQNLGFSIPFHLYIHDQHSRQAGCTGEHACTPDAGILLH